VRVPRIPCVNALVYRVGPTWMQKQDSGLRFDGNAGA
jgi:hypothetical protein